MSIGNWAIGFIILTILLKGSIGVLIGELKYRGDKTEKFNDVTSGGKAAAYEAQ